MEFQEEAKTTSVERRNPAAVVACVVGVEQSGDFTGAEGKQRVEVRNLQTGPETWGLVHYVSHRLPYTKAFWRPNLASPPSLANFFLPFLG